MALHERPVDRRSPEPPRLPEPSPACPGTGNYLDLGRGHHRDDGRTRVPARRVDSPIQELMFCSRARWLVARTRLDLVAIWEWGVVERLSTGLLCTPIHLQPLGRDTLAAAEAVAGLMT